MTAQTYLNSDLVFMVSGGIRDGELLPISTRKCMLGIEGWTDRAEQPSCAIFRGPAGVTLRNYADQILINGEYKSTHWLVDGDQIEFPNSVSLFVNQLGCIPAEFVAPENHSVDTTFNSPADSPPESEAASDRLEAQLKLDRLESQISEIAQQNQHVTGRFNELDQRLTQLTEQLSTLVTLAGNGQVVVVTSNENSESNLQPIRRAAETVVDLTDNGASTAQLPPAKYSPGTSFVKPKSHYQDPTIANEWASIEAWQRPQPVDRFLQDPVVENTNDHPDAPSLDDQNDRPDASGREIPEPPELTDEEVETDYRFREIAQLFSPSVNDQPPPASVVEKNSDFLPLVQPQPLFDFQSDASLSQSASEFQNERDQPAESNFRELTDLQIQAETHIETAELFAPAAPAPPKTESVAEILARMKSEGQWGGVGDEDEPVASAPTFQPVRQPPAPEVHSHTPARHSLPTEQEDVEDYMSQLLSRMRGGQEPTAQPVQATVSPESSVESNESAAALATGPMTLEEFIPRQKAAKIESLGAMREIANTSARTAVASSEDDRRKALAYVQLAIAVGSGIMSAYYFLVLSKSVGDTHFLIGTFCLGLTGFLGFRYYTTMNAKTPAKDSSK